MPGAEVVSSKLHSRLGPNFFRQPGRCGNAAPVWPAKLRPVFGEPRSSQVATMRVVTQPLEPRLCSLFSSCSYENPRTSQTSYPQITQITQIRWEGHGIGQCWKSFQSQANPRHRRTFRIVVYLRPSDLTLVLSPNFHRNIRIAASLDKTLNYRHAKTRSRFSQSPGRSFRSCHLPP